MSDINMMIARNIFTILKKQKKKQVELAEALETNKQTVSRMLNGARMINAIELKQIADFLGVRMEELTKIPENMPDTDIIHVFMGKVDSEQAKNALEIADKLSDMIIFHSKVKENGMAMMEGYDF
ncbi:helix-turn-helix domain-containing protein [Blautia sp. Marseille-P3201T]|uniref:helix-turn-helix domain-containing protein n=1 Tax=Blautia sp. Marseille-P3201T TaxID=1907659 RepID=UPI000930B94D|nr:helix-turn-helix transcriptional regulator [Blautia sp. Marseille-P3201T]